MVLKIDGIDIVPYVAYGGFKWQRSDVEAVDAGRGLDGELLRNRVATKIRLDITCKPLTTQEASAILTAILPEWVEVTYMDPQIGAEVTRTMYSNNNPASFLTRTFDGLEYWGGITFPLIEK